MEGIDGTIKVMMDRPWTSQGGKKIGEAKLTADMAKTTTTMAIGISDEIKKNDLAGKHAIYFVFKSDNWIFTWNKEGKKISARSAN